MQATTVGGWLKQRVLSLFSGCGGMDLGFKRAGFDVKAASDACEPAVRTHRANFPDVEMVHGDITRPETKARIVEACGGRCDIVIGGPPCTAFSTSGRRDPNDPRARLFEPYLDVIERLNPQVVITENVNTIRSARNPSGGLVFNEIVAGLRRLDYSVQHRTLNAADYGVPQRRRRVIIIAARPGIPILFPRPTHSEHPAAGDGTLPWATIRDAIGDLEDAPESAEFSHVFPRHGSSVLDRIRGTSVGDNCSLGKLKDDFYRCPPGVPARTVRSVGWHIHYKCDRLLTPREAARLQGFPDGFKFVGTKSDVALQIGNAVPPPLAEAIGLAVLGMLAARSPGDAGPSDRAPSGMSVKPDRNGSIA